MKRSAMANLCLASVLVLLVLAVRWVGSREQWDFFPPNFTPVAAVGLFAGFMFSSTVAALMVPLVALILSNLFLDSYSSLGMALTVYGCFLLAPLLGRALRRRPTWLAACVCAAVPSIVFFLVINLAQWIEDSQHVSRMYAASWHGLAACYAAGIPFFRWMIEGDFVFTAALFGAFALITALRTVRRPVPVAVKSR